LEVTQKSKGQEVTKNSTPEVSGTLRGHGFGCKNSARNRKGGEDLGFILDGRILHGTGGAGRGRLYLPKP